jgi:hypothetical protein
VAFTVRRLRGLYCADAGVSAPAEALDGTDPPPLLFSTVITVYPLRGLKAFMSFALCATLNEVNEHSDPVAHIPTCSNACTMSRWPSCLLVPCRVLVGIEAVMRVADSVYRTKPAPATADLTFLQVSRTGCL